MMKYRIRLSDGRVIGPFQKQELFQLKMKGHIKGTEEAQVFPVGDWSPLPTFDFYQELMDENKTSVITEKKDETFVINLTQIRNQVQEKEIDKMAAPGPVIAELTETVKLDPPGAKKSGIEIELDHGPSFELNSSDVPEPFDLELDNGEDSRTQINPVAREEVLRMRERLKEEEEKRKAEEDRIAKEERALQIVDEEAKAVVAIPIEDESTQMIKLDSLATDLMEIAEEEERAIENHANLVKSKEAERLQAEKAESEEAQETEQPKRKRLIMFVIAGLIVAYVAFFPEDDKPKKPPFQHIPPEIEFPIPWDKSDKMKSEAEFNKGSELFAKSSYVNVIKAGKLFKSSYENNLDNLAALNFLVRSYAEQLKSSKQKSEDGLQLFKLIKGKRPFLIQDPNGVIGLNLFYMNINKPDAAVDVVARYLKLNPDKRTPDLFAVYVMSLLKAGKIDAVKTFLIPLEKAPQKTRYTYEALIEYYTLNQEYEKAEEYIDDAMKNHPQLVTFKLAKAEALMRTKRFKEMIPFLNQAEDMALEYNELYLAKFLELKGLLLAFQGDVKLATKLLTKSLAITDSPTLRMRLADLSASDSAEADTNKLILESKAYKYVSQAKDFFEKGNFELAMSAAARGADTFPGHIASELYLAKVQLRLGLAQQALTTIAELLKKYPDNSEVNFAAIEAYINTYKFNEAKNQIAIVAASPMKASYKFPSLNAKLYIKMNDSLQAISWLRASLGVNPLNDKDIFALAEIMTKKANFDIARSLLNDCMELDPINPDYRIALANIIYETQDDQAAIGYLLGLLQEFGENPKFLSKIAIFYFRAGKIKDFMAYKDKLEKLPKKDKALYEFLIQAALLDERYQDIPGYVEELLKIEPGEIESMMTAGRVLFETGKLQEAATWFLRVKERLPSYPKVQYYNARIKYLMGDVEKAIEEAKNDIKDNGENDTSLSFLGEMYAHKGDLIEAEKLFKKAQKLNARSYEAIVGLADVSTKRSNFDQALDLYKRALKLRSDDADVYRKTGDVYRLLGQGALAIEAYKMYLEMNPEAKDKAQIESYINLMQ